MAVGEFLMPSLGADMDSGTLLEWLVAPGDLVHRGDIVAVVDTAKSAIEVEVFQEGRIAELLVAPGTEVPVGTPLATITAAGALDEAEPPPAAPGSGGPVPQGAPLQPVPAPDAPEPDAPEPDRAEPDRAEPDRDEPERDEPDQSAPPRSRNPGSEAPPDQKAAPDIAKPSVEDLARIASPPVRHLAAQRGVDLAQVPGTGPEGRVTRADVERAAVPQALADQHLGRTGRRVTPRARRLAAERAIDLAKVPGQTITGDDVPQAGARTGAPTPTPTGTDRRDAMRRATAALMARAAREIPHYYVTRTVDARPMMRWLAAHNAALPVRRRVLPIAVLLRAVTVAARAVPELNGHWIEDAFVAGDGVHLGVATATRGGGLLTPSLRNAEVEDVDTLMARLTDLVLRARKGTLRSSEIAPGTITVSSLADGGPDALFGVIYPPQVALVGVGAIAERPWSVDGMLTVRPTLTITLAADHRATDGRTGAAFLQTLSSALADPEAL